MPCSKPTEPKRTRSPWFALSSETVAHMVVESALQRGVRVPRYREAQAWVSMDGAMVSYVGERPDEIMEIFLNYVGALGRKHFFGM